MTLNVDIHEANTHGSKLVEQAAKGREFVIAKAGRPLVSVAPITAIPAVRAMGLLAGKGVITAGVETAVQAEIGAIFAQAV